MSGEYVWLIQYGDSQIEDWDTVGVYACKEDAEKLLDVIRRNTKLDPNAFQIETFRIGFTKGEYFD